MASKENKAEADELVSPEPDRSGQYIVVARRYRPQDFGDLVGQDMVSKALCNALETDRVGHAYLFTGARGVGKTSTARIFSKMLNCSQGPTTKPCHECDICRSISSGEDVDVLEIDGASNRGIDEIRQLRSNVGVRPSRGRCKVYIIDEVHMLTKEAFNALLKTLEEPPDHVKFIFCTTAPEKIPITVLSRCQRFDFSPVGQEKIVGRLQEIVTAEGATAEPEALEILARRAAGSMRDSQSLLEQLLSFSGTEITVDAVHGMLGTAKNTRVRSLTANLLERNAAGALGDVDAALAEGVDAGQLAEQLIGSMRDMLALGVGSAPEALRYSSASDAEQLRSQAESWGIETLLAAVQIVDQALVRMRQSMHARIILETAIVRIARLENLQALADLAAQVEAGQPLDVSSNAEPKTTPVKKKQADTPLAKSPADSPQVRSEGSSPPVSPTKSIEEAASSQLSPVPAAARLEPEPKPAPKQSEPDKAQPTGNTDEVQPSGNAKDLTPQNVQQIWLSALQTLNDLTADNASHYHSVTCEGPTRLVLSFTQTYNSSKAFCERPDRRTMLQDAVAEIVGGPVRIDFASVREDAAEPTPPQPTLSRAQRQRQVAENPFVKTAVELFEAEVSSVDYDSARKQVSAKKHRPK